MSDMPKMDLAAVSIDLHHEISQFLYTEAHMLDKELLREWLDGMVHPDICYQMVITEERFRRDRGNADRREVKPYDDNWAALELRIRQFETGLQTMMDPPQRLYRIISNIRAFHIDQKQKFKVFSHGTASRFRRQYEHEQVVYAREDILVKGDDGALRLAKRRIELGQRIVMNKNLLFFL